MEKLHHIKNRIVGKRVVEVRNDPDGNWGGRVHPGDRATTLVLDDGSTLRLYMSDSDCCASAYGTWEILDPDRLDAVITDVQFEQEKDYEDNGDGHDSTAKITILHNQNKLALADCYANDGNGGYYYSALSMTVAVPGKKDLDAKVIES